MSNIVTFEQAKKLKELGFNNEVRFFYKEDGTLDFDIITDNYNELEGIYSAHSVSDALQWIRDNKQICCGININRYKYEHKYMGENGIEHYSQLYDTYPEAETALLDELLNYLE